MHKGVILLIEAEDRDEAVTKAGEFLDGYQNSVWDWYVIGGRWSGTLNALNTEFMKRADYILKPEENGFISTKMVNENKQGLQDLWESMGGKGNNPYARDTYKHEGDYDDVVPLSDCLGVVKEWQQDPKEESEKELARMKEWEGDTSMQGYVMKRAGELLAQYFCFDCNVYNIETGDYSLPREEEIGCYYAVMIDMHN